jgi:pyruvate/2-oxoglutarate dehydrogenase complex dihydrolipoamide dehydrogenase (E3) component
MVDVIVIGGGPAGVTAAIRARELGAQVTLIERKRLGGTCTNDGCVPTRVLAKAARLMRDAEHFAAYGLQAERPTVDFAQLIARTQQVVDQVHAKKQTIAHLTEVGVQVIENSGGAAFVDPYTIELGDGRRLSADRFIIAAGGHARRFEFPGSEYADTHHDVWNLRELPKSVAIVGASATGTQLASIFSAFGTDVTLLEAAPRILAREDASIAKVMRQAFETRGVRVIEGIGGVERIDKEGDLLRLTYKLGDGLASLDVERVLLAVGWVGNVESLNLPAAGLAGTARGYIEVNDYLQSAVPHIFAAGDITGRMMLVQSGSYEGRMAAENAVLGPGQPNSHFIVPHGSFTDPEYAAVGLTEDEARAQFDVAVVTIPYSELDRAVIDDRTEGFFKLIVSQETHRVLGAHIVGEQAVEAVQIVAAGMAAGMWVEQLAELELAYPTYTAIVGLAARRMLRLLGVMPLAEQWQALGSKLVAEWERSA